SQTFRPEVQVRVDDGQVVIDRAADSKTHRAMHGLTRALVANMVQGTVEGFRKTLELVGVGYRAEKKGKVLVLNVGYSHPVEYPEPEGRTIRTPNHTTVGSEGSGKQRVGQVAAEIRAVRPPGP